jgi:hypothetical protein
MAEIKSESVADFIPESVADFPRNTHWRAAVERLREPLTVSFSMGGVMVSGTS